MFQRTKNVGDAPLGEDRLRPPPDADMASESPPADSSSGPDGFPYPGMLGGPGSNQSAELMRGSRLGGQDRYDPGKPVAQGDLADMVDLECAARLALLDGGGAACAITSLHAQLL